MSAGAAALAKNASDEYDHIVVVRVWKSSGESIKTAGSSFIDTKNTRAKAIAMPGFNNGRVTEREVWNLPLPKVKEDSSNRGLICNKVDFTGLIPMGRYRMTHANINRNSDW